MPKIKTGIDQIADRKALASHLRRTERELNKSRHGHHADPQALQAKADELARRAREAARAVAVEIREDLEGQTLGGNMPRLVANASS